MYPFTFAIKAPLFFISYFVKCSPLVLLQSLTFLNETLTKLAAHTGDTDIIEIKTKEQGIFVCH